MDKKIPVLTAGKQLFKKAGKYLVSGVNSPVRAFRHVNADPLLIKHGWGSTVYDYDGREFIDYVLSWGACILGHAQSEVVRDLEDAIQSGLGFGTTHINEITLAEIITGAAPFIRKIRFVNSGTEAVMGAIRLSRGYTGRDKIIKFEHSYHGHADYLLSKSGSGLATLNIASSKGVPQDFIKHTLVLPYGDIERIEQAFKKHGKEIAGIIVEPVAANYGVVPADEAFLKNLRRITERYGALLIFDEVVTGFRFGFGTVAGQLGIIPDLMVLGKIIGGGLPIGAYGGKKEIMNNLAPMGGVYQASTFAGNPVVMQAGIATLRVLKSADNEYARTEGLARRLVSGISEKAQENGIEMKINYYRNIFSFSFKRKKEFSRFYLSMLKQGIYFAPSEFEADFLSFAHTKDDIDKTISSSGYSFKKVKEKII